MQKIDELNEVPVIGEYYLVPRVVFQEKVEFDENEYCREERFEIDPNRYMFVTPVFNNSHNDTQTCKIQIKNV